MEGKWLIGLAVAIMVKIIFFSIWNFVLMKSVEKDKPLEDEEALFHILQTQ